VVLATASLTVAWRLVFQTGQPALSVALRDTSGAVTRATDGSIVLAALGPMPAPLSANVREFVDTGGAAATGPVAAAMAALRPDVTRGVPSTGQDPSKPRPVPLGPMLTAIRSSQPTLRWTAVADATEYKVQVAGQDGTTVWQASAGAQAQ